MISLIKVCITGDDLVIGAPHCAGARLRLPPGGRLALASQGCTLLCRKTGHLG